MDPLTAGIYALLILSVCATVLLFNRQLTEGKTERLKLKREIVEMKALIHEMDEDGNGAAATDGGTSFHEDIDFEHEPE